jgi:hypothetical protein
MDEKEIDKMTMEMFMNRKNYKKYLEKTDPAKFSDLKMHHEDIEKYHGSIISITDDLLENPNLQISNEVNQIFDAYTKVIIRYLKHKEMEKTLNNEFENSKADEDVMFGEIDEPNQSNQMNSYWSGETVVKQSSKTKDISKFGVDMFLRSSRS